MLITVCVIILAFIPTKYFSFDLFKRSPKTRAINAELENIVDDGEPKYENEKNYNCFNNENNFEDKEINMNNKNNSKEKIILEKNENQNIFSNGLIEDKEIKENNNFKKSQSVKSKKKNSANKFNFSDNEISQIKVVIKDQDVPNNPSSKLFDIDIKLNDIVGVLNDNHQNEQKSPESLKSANDLEENGKKKTEDDEISIFYVKEHELKMSIKEKIKDFFGKMKKVLKVKTYVFCVLAVCVLNFISTAIQYWVSDYFKNVLKFDEDSVFICFVITCVTAPTLGIIVGGCIVQKYGGYESKKSIFFVLGFGIICASDAILITFQKTIIGYSIVLWIFLFFGGAMVPNLIGKFF